MELMLISRRGNPEEVYFLNKALYPSWGEDRREAIKKLAELEATSALFMVAQRSKWTDERKLAEEEFLKLKRRKK